MLAAVRERLAREKPATVPSETGVVAELDHLRESLHDGSTKTEDRAALVQQWDRQQALLRQLRTADRPIDVDPGSPYFAHFRLHENDREHDILLGKSSRLLPDFPIVDWRNAPISRLFFRFRQGEEYEETISGRLRAGEVAVRRTVTIREGMLRRVDAPEGSFETDETATDGWRAIERRPPRLSGGERSALRVHEAPERARGRFGVDSAGVRQRADKHLPEIASLLDPEQFALITQPGPGFLVIRGTAGSGKTTVALHRIAYLAYDDPRMDSPATLVLMFSSALRDYVSHVLPGLGVHGVQVRTFHDWATEQTRRLFPRLPRARNDHTPADAIRVKLHPALLDVLARHVAEVPPEGSIVTQVIDDWASALARGPLIADALAGTPDAPSPEGLGRAIDWHRARRDELRAWIAGEPGVDAALDAEDDAILLHLWQLRTGALPARDGQPLRYRHVVIDEVQDFSPIEVQVLLGCLDERKSLTLAGDTQQHISTDGGFSSWSAFLSRLGLQGTAVQTLETNYRCTTEIADFAGGVLGPLREEDEPSQTIRSGPPVELFRFTDHGAGVAFLADALADLAHQEPLASVAVLTPSAALSALYHHGLEACEVPRLRRVAGGAFTFSPGIEVTEIEQAKGLEFDYVVLVEVSTTHFPDTPSSRRRLYVGATRAIHQLWLTSVGTPAAAVRQHLA